MKIVEIDSKTALHKLKRKGLPYQYDLNIYRGCSHGCKYCYALCSKKYLNDGDPEDTIYVKKDIIVPLERELHQLRGQQQIINIGGVCDSYQAAEKKYGLMREVLKLMIKYKNPVIISTKSNLIQRDVDLIDELGKTVYVNIALCITTDNNDISKKVEPNASLPMDRLAVLTEISATHANTGFHIMPILPLLCDKKESLERLTKWCKESNADYMLTGMLYLTGGIKKRYFEFIKLEFPEYYNLYCELYPKGGADKNYKSEVHSFLGEMRNKYGVNNNYSKFLPKKKSNPTLF